MSEASYQLPSTALIVASRNRPKMLSDVVESILQGDALPSEILIIDQSDVPHPTLGQLTSERGCRVRYVWTTIHGLSRANNAGLAATTCERVAFTHDDVLVGRSWFGSLIGALIAAGPSSVVTGRVSVANEDAGHFVLTTKDRAERSVYRGRIGEDVLLPLNMAMTRTTLQEIGGFDERLGPGGRYHSAEDNDLGYRLLEAGDRIVYVPEAVVRHRAWRTQDAFVSLRWAYGLGQGAFYAKHLRLRDAYMRQRAWRDLYRHLRRIPSRVKRGERHGAWADLVYSVALTSGMLDWTAREHAPRIMHLPWTHDRRIPT